jgi:hypothetical protein
LLVPDVPAPVVLLEQVVLPERVPVTTHRICRHVVSSAAPHGAMVEVEQRYDAKRTRVA